MNAHSPPCLATETPTWQPIRLVELTRRLREDGWRWSSGPCGPCLTDAHGRTWDFDSSQGVIQIRPSFRRYLDSLLP